MGTEKGNYRRIVVYAKKSDASNVKKAKANGYALSSLFLSLLDAYINNKIDPKILQEGKSVK